MADEYKYEVFISYSHHIDADPDELFIGMPMQAVLKPKAEHEGSILDTVGLKPVE